MKKFTFRLEKLLDLKKWREKNQLQKFAQAQMEKTEANRQLILAKQEVVDFQKEQGSKINGTIDVHSALLMHRFHEKLLRETNDCREMLKDAEQRLREERESLIDASRERQSLEILQTKKRTEYDKEAIRSEQITMDEDAGRRHGSTNGLKTE